ALEIPHTLTESCLERTGEVAIEISSDGTVNILNDELLECIRSGVLGQTGLPMETGVRSLNSVFGEFETLVTTTHPNVQIMGGKIIAEGVPRKIAEGPNEKITILANNDVNISSSNDGDTSLGQIQSIHFSNGVLILKPNGCYLAWLKHHEDGKIPKDYVQGIKTDLDRELNEQTQCEEPAIDLEVLANQNSALQVQKVGQFNDSLDHMGPFSVFETPTQRFIISSEPNDAGACEDHLRVIDKETGEVVDYTGDITQTPDGFKITTKDGEEHDVKFSTKDGAPFVQLDGQKPEVLTAAQGKNGSFYYDPDKGIWFAENAQLLPLIEAFRDGIAAKVGPGGEATATASGNVLNANFGDDEGSGFLNLPSLPENRFLLLLMLLVIVASFVAIRARKKPAKKK
ncbi:MAG: hypothetical protein NUV67_02010, partial [archaeon]|nr:hypothetical protein [archaeon]